MKGFKDCTKTIHGEFSFPSDGKVQVRGYARGGPAKKAKVAKVMHEFGQGALRSGSDKGPKVTNPKQAIAIALSEAKREPMKKARGGTVGMRHDTPKIGC